MIARIVSFLALAAPILDDPVRHVTVNEGQTTDLVGNSNRPPVSVSFLSGERPGVTNAPVAPDTIYLGLGGVSAGLSVIDLNGFGASTGDPTFDFTYSNFSEGNTNYPNNPNVRIQGALVRPPLAPGTTTVDGGSSGVFTLTRDSNLDPVLARAPCLADVSDLALGHALDSTFNNAPPPFGCQAGGGSPCSRTELKLMQVIQGGPKTLTPPILSNPILNTVIGGENPISWAPHPNPPPLVSPPLCLSPRIEGQEPTSVDTLIVDWQSRKTWIHLYPGDPFGDPLAGVPPSGLLTTEQNMWFEGPSLSGTNPDECRSYAIRQQIGHFLYVVDRARRELVVLNSNRMTPIDRIALPDPVELAVGPNLDLLAVSNRGTDNVSFVDIDPASATFHQVVKETAVGAGPRGIAWDSLNEDILVCNEGDSTVSVIAAFTLSVRKVLTNHLDRPFAIALTPRQTRFGWFRNVYFGYVLNRDGTVAIFESGPDGVNGFGYDDIIGLSGYTFHEPKAVQVDPTDLRSGVWIVHEGAIDLATGRSGSPGPGAATHLYLECSVLGPQPLDGDSRPHFREVQPRVAASLGEEVLSGVPVDLAFDNQRNLGALVNEATSFSAGVPAVINGKSLVRDLGWRPQGVSAPRFLFLAVPGSRRAMDGAVDVIELADQSCFDTNAFREGVQSIPAPGVSRLMDYFRQ